VFIQSVLQFIASKNHLWYYAFERSVPHQSAKKIENEVTMPSSSYFLLLLVILIAYLFFRRFSPGGGPVKGKDITEDPTSPLKKWDCSRDDRTIIFSNVPVGLTPYLIPFNESALRAQPKDGFKVLLSIAADVRFRDDASREIDKFESLVTLWMSYNAQDLEKLQKADYKVSDLVPVKIIPGATNWKPFSANNIDYSKIERGEQGGFGGVSITVDSWGDPPMGWGSPKSAN
jgi:hypothetical protein